MHEWVLCPRGPSRGHYGLPELHMKRYSFLGSVPERTTLHQDDPRAGTSSSGERPRPRLCTRKIPEATTVHLEGSRGHDSSPGRYTRGYSFLGRSPEGTTVRPSDSQVGISSSGGLPSALLSTWMTRERVFGPRQCSRGHYVPPERYTRRYSVLGWPPESTTMHPEDSRGPILFTRRTHEAIYRPRDGPRGHYVPPE
jgi:hypothetical protein